MSKVAILTDSNSGITQEEAEQAGIYVFPTPVYINDEVFYEGVDLTTDQFFARQAEGAEIKTSMPVVGDVIDKWESLLEEYDEVVYIPLSSGLSSSCETAIMLAEDYDGKVQVVNNQRISVTMKLSVYDAKKLADAGCNGKTVVMGIRPEDIGDSEIEIEAHQDCAFEADVTGYELLGSEVLLYFKVAGTSMTAKVDSRTTARMGDHIKLAIDPEKIHVFDKETELTITN